MTRRMTPIGSHWKRPRRAGACWCCRSSSPWSRCCSRSPPAGARSNGSHSRPCRSASQSRSRSSSPCGRAVLRSSICSAAGLRRSASRSARTGCRRSMMVTTAVVICAIGVFARADFRTPAGSAEARAPFAFWILLLAVWGALDTVFLAGDLFTLYVALELLTFAAVPLVCLDGRAETLQAALRYLLFALLGSVLYLVGTALLYGAYGTLDIVLLSAAGPGRARDHHRGRADDGGAARQDRAVPAASVAAAGSRRRAGGRQRRAVGAGGEGIVLHRGAAVVRCDAGAAGPGRRATARRARRGGHSVRQRRRAAAGAIEAPDRLLDAGADRLSLPDVSARARPGDRCGSTAAAPWRAACCRRCRTRPRRPPCSWPPD